VDELHDTATVSEALWKQLQALWNEAQLVELLVLVGWYHLISFVANAAHIELESWAARFPLQSENE
jgi:4-carboxymuconolactone decarboxylase